jgi:hypothetical protein
MTSKLKKIGLLDDPGSQGSSPKDFIFRLDLSNVLIKASKREIQVWLLLDFTVGL